MKIVTTHNNCDFDALASVIAISLLKPDFVPVLPGNLNPNVKAFMSLHKDVFKVQWANEIDQNEVTGVIIVDTSSWNRIAGLETLKGRNDLVLELWDHHPGDDILPSVNNSEVIGSTISILIKKLKTSSIRITPIHSTLFLLGIYEDTGYLAFDATTSEDAHAAAYLLEQKADLTILRSFLQQAYGEKQKDILYEMMKHSERIKLNGFVISISRLTIDQHIRSLSVVVGMYREILNADAAFGIFNDLKRERCMVIGRSDNEGIDIGEIMFNFRGGGHPGAGSALIKKGDPETIEKIILGSISGNQHSSVQVRSMMTYPVKTADENSTMRDVALTLKTTGCSGLPVVGENDELLGVISRRDFKKIRKESQLDSPVKAYMSRSVVSIEPNRSSVEAVKTMIANDIGRLPVIENGKIIGIITRTDAMRYMYDIMPN